MNLLKNILKKNTKQLILLVVLMLGQVWSQMTVTGYVNKIVNFAMQSISEEAGFAAVKSMLLRKLILMTGLSLAAAGLIAAVGYLVSKISNEAEHDLRSILFRKVMAFSLPETDRFSISNLISTSTYDVKVIQTALFAMLLAFIPAPFYAVIGFASVAGFNAGMSWIVILIIVLTVAVSIVIFRRVIRYAVRTDETIDKLSRFLRESLSGIQVIRAFGREKWSTERSIGASEELEDYSLNMNRSLQLFTPVINLLMNASTVLVMWIGAYKASSGLIQIGELIAYTSYIQLIVSGFVMFSTGALLLPKMITSLKRISKIVDSQQTVTDGEQELSPSEKIDSLTFDHVSFRFYENSGYVLNDICFSAEKGKITAMIGDAGAGKTTVLRLIERLYDVSAGAIRINDSDIRSYRVKDLRSHIGYVPQTNFLFSGDISSNIAFGEENPDFRTVEEAARIACADGFISEKKDRFAEKVVRGGMNFSGGQRQRLAIARAVGKDRDIYLFDDSFSALDYQTDLLVRKALRRKAGDSITVIVSQRVSTVMDADQIIVLDKGRIVGKGTHSELIGTCSVYREIARSQMSEEDFLKNCCGAAEREGRVQE